MATDYILAFDTASENIALALGRWKTHQKIDLIASDDHPAIRQANVQLMPSIDALLRENGVQRTDINCVACGLGPGSFTGVRIGVATAKGISFGLRVPLYGVSTLDAVAWEAWANEVRGRIAVVADAMRGEVYPARFILDDRGTWRLDSHLVTKAQTIAQQWRDKDEHLLLFGDGLKKFAEEFTVKFADDNLAFTIGEEALWVPSGRGLLLAFEAACASDVQGNGEAGSLLPIYTRLSDAEENERRRLANGGHITQGAVVDVPRSGVTDPTRQELITYRPMASADLDWVSALEAASFQGVSTTSGESWTYEMFADELASEGRTWWVAYEEDLLVGFAGALVVDGALQILDVCVSKSHRRRGIARELLKHLFLDGVDLGAEKALLEVRESNGPAQSLYSSLGFRQIGTRPNYYSPREDLRRETAVIMEKALLDSHSSSTNATSSEAQRDCARGSHTVPVVLAIETSCDETAAAVIDGQGKLLSDTVASQVDFHARFGGVVPEIASRKHTEAIVGVVDAAMDEAKLSSWQELDALAVTYAPGLIGALVVGVAFAKGLSWATELPLIRVNHLEGHIYANRFAQRTHDNGTKQEVYANRFAQSAQNNSLEQERYSDQFTQEGTPIKPPFIIALLSGGHTMLVFAREWGDYRIMGQTLDDAVGEAFDKVAKALGLGYPGGPVISKLAEQGDPAAIDFPRALLHSHDYRFSLSGLKTAVITYIKTELEAGRKLDLPNIAASFQQAVFDVQVAKALAALEETGCETFCIGGGVAANEALRDAYVKSMSKRGIRVILPPTKACTDNAAMIALVALDRFKNQRFMGLADDAFAQTDLEKPY